MLLVGVLAAIGVAVVAFGCGGTIGLHVDSAGNIEAARHLLQGNGLSQLSEQGLIPVTIWAPLYSALLAILGSLGLEPLDGAKWLNASFFGGTIALAGYVIHRCTNSTSAAAFGALLILTAPQVLYVHMMALTEPPFLFFSILAVLLMSLYAEKPRMLYLAAGATALASLARYPGMALVAAGVLGMLARPRVLARRVHDAATFGVLASLPLGIWFLRNLMLAHVVTGRGTGLRLIKADEIKSALFAYASWVVPDKLPAPLDRYRALTLIVALIGSACLGYACVAAGRQVPRTEPRDSVLARVATFGALFAVCYTAFLILAASLTGSYNAPLAFRYQVPVFVFMTIFTVSQGARLRRGAPGPALLRVATLVFCLVFAASYFARGAAWVANSYRHGLGYSSRAWTRSATMEKVKAFPGNVWVYTNVPEAVYLLANKLADSFPPKPGGTLPITQHEYDVEIARLRGRVHDGKAIVAYFREMPGRELPGRAYLASEQELATLLELDLVEETDDGAIYGPRG